LAERGRLKGQGFDPGEKWMSRSETQVLLVGAALGRNPITYRWQKDSQDIPGATSPSLVLNNVGATNTGLYTLIVSNAFGATNTQVAVLTVKKLVVFANGQPVTNGTFSGGNPVMISLASSFANGSIFYTLDGSVPDLSKTSYSGTFAITASQTLRAVAYSADFSESAFSDPLAVIILPNYALFSSNLGGGTITIMPATGVYLSNTIVTLVATPSPGFTFMGWSGDVSGNDLTNTITMNGDRTVRPQFGTTLVTTVAGNGSVSRSPVFPLFPFGSIVKITAVANPGNYFALWGNAAGGSQNPLSFVINSATQTVSSLFAPLPANEAALSIATDGGGHVTINPLGNKHPVSTALIFTAVPDYGQKFIGWAGDASGSQNPLSVVMDTSKVVTAHFSRIPTLKIEMDAERLMTFTISGVPGSIYQIKTSTNLSQWEHICTITNFFDTQNFSDPAWQSFDHRMYHAVEQ
jgi:hypothetical protein